MITLQADPLVEWDETKTRVMDQSQECQDWLAENLMGNTNKTVVNETVSRPSGRADLTRPATYTFNDGTFELVQTFTYNSEESYAGMKDNSVLTLL